MTRGIAPAVIASVAITTPRASANSGPSTSTAAGYRTSTRQGIRSTLPFARPSASLAEAGATLVPAPVT
jgi:hypothetical protein